MNTSVCVKIGGATIDQPGILDEFAQAILALKNSGYFPVVVHGGGKDIGHQLALLNKQFSFVEGMRVTDAETMHTVQMVLSGDVNKRIVNKFVASGLDAVGVCGIDMNLFTAKKLLVNGQDIGFVGSISKVDVRFIDICRQNNMVPVISPVSRDVSGDIFNVNADVAAAELAKAMKCDHLMFVSDVEGVLVDGAVVHSIHTSEIEKLAEARHVTGGMLPKLRSAAEAVNNGVGKVHIHGWRGPDTLTRELSNETMRGTAVYS
jgi:acetylglutamate kinase